MSHSEILTTDYVGTGEGLVATLSRIFAYVGVNPAEVHTFGNKGKPLRIEVIMDTLTDGSKVYNISIE